MRGHWVSQTRKLNKHYQSAPRDDDYGIFYVSSCLAPRGLSHTDSPGAYNDHDVFYNQTIRDYANYDAYNLAGGQRCIGYRYNKTWDGAFLQAGRANVLWEGETYPLGGGYGDPLLNFANGVLTTGTGPKGPVYRMPECYQEEYRERVLAYWGFQFARYHVPNYGCGPAKKYGDYQASCNFDINKPVQLSIPDYNGMMLSAKATFDAAHVNTVHTQFIDGVGGGHSGLTLLSATTAHNDLNFSVWERLECNGLSYYDNGNSYEFSSERAPTRQCFVRVYVFFQDGDLWITTRPRLIDTVTGDDVTDDYDFYLEHCIFPHTPNGYLTREPFLTQGLEYYSGNPQGGICQTFPLSRTGTVYARGYGLDNKFGYEIQQLIRVYKMSLKQFFDMEQAFHDRVGGTSYYDEFGRPWLEEDEDEEEDASQDMSPV